MIVILRLNIFFRKGLLFIRLNGILTKETAETLSSSIDHFLYESGVKYLCINLEELDYLDEEGINVLKEKYSSILKANSYLILCGCANTYVENALKDELGEVKKVRDELSVFQMIEI